MGLRTDSAFTAPDLADRAAMHAEFTGQRLDDSALSAIRPLSRRECVFNFQDRRVSQFTVASAFAERASLLTIHVGRIVLNGAKKQMRGIHALAIVAGMTDPQAIWNRAIRHLVCEPWCFTGPSVDSSAANFEQPVAVTVTPSRPVPAIARLVDFLEEALSEIARLFSHPHSGILHFQTAVIYG